MLPLVGVLSIHTTLPPTTKDMIQLSHLKAMKPTAILINCARGDIVNGGDLWKALKEGIIAPAGVDAWISGPPTREVYGDTLDLENLVMSPHIGGSPAEVQTATCKSMCDHMRARDRVA